VGRPIPHGARLVLGAGATVIGFDEARLLHIRRGAPVPGDGHGGTLVADPPSATAAIGASETEGIPILALL